MEARIPLTIEPYANSLAEIILHEPVELALLDKLIHCKPLLKETFHDPVGKFYYGEKGEAKMLQDYRNNYGRLRVAVRYTRNKDIEYGRFLPDKSLGLHNMRRMIRHTLIGEWGQDVDIENAHPRMLEQITTIHKIKNDWLVDYCNNREEWLAETTAHWGLDQHPEVVAGRIKAREIGKSLFIALAYGGGINRWRENWKVEDEYEIPDRPPPEKVANFKREIRNIHKKISDANPHLTAQVVAHKTKHGQAEGTYNLNGSVCSYYLQEWESRILEHIFQYCLQKKYIQHGETMLCADGIILNKKFYHDRIPIELEAVIAARTGFRLKVEPKAMDRGFTAKQIKEAMDFELHENGFLTGEIANYFRVLYSDKFVFSGGELKGYNGVYWRSDGEKNHSTLHNFVDTTFYQHLSSYIYKKMWEHAETRAEIDPEDKVALQAHDDKKKRMVMWSQEMERQCRNVRQRSNLVADIINKITNVDIIWDDDPFKLCFTNKIYDLKTGKWVATNYRDYISQTTGYDWNDYELHQRTIELKKLLDTIFPDPKIRDYYLTALATGLYGVQQENINIATGVGGNGKSLLNELMLAASGNYGYKLSKEVLQEDSKLGACPEIANLHNKRFVLTCEPKKSKSINTSTMKEITGNPTLNARQLYKNMVEGGVLLKLTLFLEANKLPTLDEVGEATERRVNVYPFESRFLKEADYLKLTEKMTADEIRAAHVFVGDPRYKTDEWKRDNRQALIFVLMDYFKQFQANNYTMGEAPEQCATAKKEYMQESDNIYGWFESVFEKTEGGEPLGFKDIYNLFTLSNYYNNLTKKERKDYNLKKFTKEISENLFLAPNIRKRDTRYNGVALKKDAVVGWRLKPEEKAGGGAHDDEAYAEEK